MQKQYLKVARLARELKAASYNLDQMIDKRWGFNYSQTDDDRIIDTLDYGTDCLSYSEFVEKMNAYQREVELGERSLNV